MLCFVTIPVSFYHPIGGLVCFGVISNKLRHETAKKYNAESDDINCCADPQLNCCFNYVHNACNYPCSLFQVLVSMDEWDQQNAEKRRADVSNPVLAQPPVSVKAIHVQPVK